MSQQSVLSPSRMPLIDALKAVASQLIVLHHLAAYGPLSEAMQEVMPRLMEWLFDYGRIAVQVFLVVAGFLAAKGLAPHGRVAFVSPWPLLWKRYQRLVVPFLVAVVLAMVCAAIARQWMIDDSIPEKPAFLQFLAHATLFHGVLGVDSLSAGVWYIAIDFQLFALMTLVLWASQRSGAGPWAPFGVIVLAVTSLFWFNRDAGWDNWAIYFFGSYGLGAAAWWASERGRLAAWLGALAAVVVAALMVDFRLRIVVALAVALLLGFARRGGWLERWPESRVLGYLGQISYSVFLVHFPLCLVINALFLDRDWDTPTGGVIGMALAWAASIAAGALFHRYVESAAPGWRLAPLGRFVRAVLRRMPSLGFRRG